MDGEKIICLVAAAGRGKRFGREMPKTFHPVAGLTLLVRSLKSLSAWDGISRFVVMVPEGWEQQAEKDIAENFSGIEAVVTAGGETRQESVAIGLEAAGDADIVLNGDGHAKKSTFFFGLLKGSKPLFYGIGIKRYKSIDLLIHLFDPA